MHVGRGPRGPVESSYPAPATEPAPLPVDEVEAIRRAIRVAAADPELAARAEATAYRAFGTFAGAARNLWSMLTGRDPGDPETAKRACTGIAARAARVLEGARVSGRLPEVAAVREIERRAVPGRDGPLTPYHTAVELELSTGLRVVLDWHATLDVDAPRISTPETF